MAEHSGEKTQQPTPKKLEEALKKGQVARSAEIQTFAALLAGLAVLSITGRGVWQQLAGVMTMSLGHLHDTALSAGSIQGHALHGAIWFGKVIGPVVMAIVATGLLVGGIQNRFNTASEALGFHWEKINPVEGFGRLFSGRQAVPTLLAILKLTIIGMLTWSQIRAVFNDPIFSSAVTLNHVGAFMARAGWTICLRVVLALGALACIDYGYQWWRNHRDLMMTTEEVKEEMKNTEGNPMIKSARRRMRAMKSKRKMLAEVPKADVVLVNPTHIAVALRYDRRTMKAPKIVAKGIRLNALSIREMAEKHRIPVMENKPLARLMFKYGKVGHEIPAQLYAAVAEVLAWVYRVNRYHYFAQENSGSANQ